MSYIDTVICIRSLPILETWPPIYRGQERTKRDMLRVSQSSPHVYFRYTPCLTDFTFDFIRRPTPPILSPSYWTFVELTLVSYIVNSIHDATESYYERGKHGLMDLNNIKFPLFMLQILKWHLFYLSMFATMCLVDLFSYKIPIHRKWFRFKCVSYLLFNSLSCFKFLYGTFALSSFRAPM
jgi:hypothetical protein